MDWHNVLQVAKNCSKYACTSMNEPFSDEWESEGAFAAYQAAIRYMSGRADRTLDEYIAFWTIRLVRRAIGVRRKRNSKAKPTCPDKLALQLAKDAEQVIIEREDEIFITRMLEGKKCQQSQEMIAKYVIG